MTTREQLRQIDEAGYVTIPSAGPPPVGTDLTRGFTFFLDGQPFAEESPSGSFTLRSQRLRSEREQAAALLLLLNSFCEGNSGIDTEKTTVDELFAALDLKLAETRIPF